MTFRGHVQNGVVIVDDGVCLPEGTSVSCTLTEDMPATAKEEGGLYANLMPLAGKASSFPEDASMNACCSTHATDCQ